MNIIVLQVNAFWVWEKRKNRLLIIPTKASDYLYLYTAVAYSLDINI